MKAFFGHAVPEGENRSSPQQEAQKRALGMAAESTESTDQRPQPGDGESKLWVGTLITKHDPTLVTCVCQPTATPIENYI